MASPPPPLNLLIILLSLIPLLLLLPFVHSLSTLAISETGNQTLACTLTPSNSLNTFLNCTSFPQRVTIPLNPQLSSVSGLVGGNGFICALSSFYSSSSSSSVLSCWRFSDIGSMNMSFARVYRGHVLKDLDAGNSRICGLTNGSESLQCWQPQNSNQSNVFSSSIAVGEGFVCGLSDQGRVGCVGSVASVTGRVPEGMFSQVEAGFRHACAVSVNGSLECWGDMVGEVPQGEFSDVALGENRGCAIRRSDEMVVCWGENGFSMPGSLRNESFISVEGKRRVFCGVLTSNYSMVCWGDSFLDSNPLVFNGVVPGPCRSSDECSCGTLPGYGVYCGQGLVICRPCDNMPVSRTPPPSIQPIPPPQIVPSPSASNGKWNRKMVAFLVVGCVGSFALLVVLCIFVFSRFFKISGSRIHDSGRLEEGVSPQQSGQAAQSQTGLPPTFEKKLSHLISMGTGGHLEEFPLQVLLEATGAFSEEHRIGTGSYGSVYHATLPDGREVAIKRAESSVSSSYAGATKRGLEDKDGAFLNELEFLSRLNHKNLVRLLGYCEDCNERLLVYEYMENGTLFDHLHKLESSPLMSWAKRIKVALDAARGIEYLHEYAVPRIIHRDIKSSNILLDATWTAKVSDFGLSLLGPQDDESHLSLHAVGTMGYVDPEYYRLQLLTTKSDVYSFGIVLLELLSGRKAIHKNEDGVPRNVVDYVVPYIVQDDIHRVLDRRVPPPTPFEIEAVAYVGYLAADCVMPEGRDRPTMSEVVNSLDRALEACLAPPVLSRSTTNSST